MVICKRTDYSGKLYNRRFYRWNNDYVENKPDGQAIVIRDGVVYAPDGSVIEP